MQQLKILTLIILKLRGCYANLQYAKISYTKIAGLLCNLEDLENLEKSGNLIFDQKIRENQHFIQNSGKVREFENLNAGSNFHSKFKTKLLNIQSYIGTLNDLFLGKLQETSFSCLNSSSEIGNKNLYYFKIT